MMNRIKNFKIFGRILSPFGGQVLVSMNDLIRSEINFKGFDFLSSSRANSMWFGIPLAVKESRFLLKPDQAGCQMLT